MEAAFVLGLSDGPGLLQQIGLDVCSHDVASNIKVDADEFAKSGRVVVLHGFGIAEGF